MATYCPNCLKFVNEADPVSCPYCGYRLKKSKFFSDIFRLFKKATTEPSKEKQSDIPLQKTDLKELPTQFEIMQVENLIRQLQESVDLINSTTSPRTFWGRLNLALDVLLELQKYEKYELFKQSTPTQDYNKILDNLEATVNAFIDRVIVAQSDKNDLLNTQKEKDKRMLKCVKSLWNSFYEANDCCQGNNMLPHYTGKLYTDSNFKRVDDILCELELKSISNQNATKNTPTFENIIVSESYSQDPEQSITTEDGTYDFSNFSTHEKTVINKVIKTTTQKYPYEYRSIGFANESSSLVYKARYILFEIIIQLYANSDNPIDQFAVSIAYKSKGACFREKALYFFEKASTGVSPDVFGKYMYFMPFSVYLEFSKLYEKEHDYEKAIDLAKKASAYGDIGNRIFDLEEKLSNPPRKRKRSIPVNQVILEESISAAAKQFIKENGL